MRDLYKILKDDGNFINEIKERNMIEDTRQLVIEESTALGIHNITEPELEAFYFKCTGLFY